MGITPGLEKVEMLQLCIRSNLKVNNELDISMSAYTWSGLYSQNCIHGITMPQLSYAPFSLVGGAAQAAAGTTGSVSSMLLAATDQDYQKVSSATPFVHFWYLLHSQGARSVSFQSHRHLQNNTSEGLVSNVKLGGRFFIKVC